MSDNNLIIGSGNKVINADNLIVIGCQDQEYDETHSNTVRMANDAFVINDNGVVEAAVAPNKLNRTANFTTDYAHKIYFCDCTAGNITATITDTGIDYTFVKVDGSVNKIILDPQNGNINGASTYEITSQYQKVTTVWDGTDYYV